MPTVSFYTLGCKLNYAETNTIARDFEQKGFTVVPFDAGSDVAVINTCSVTEEADRQCRQVIRRVLRKNPETFVAVTGCYAQLRPDEIAAIPGVDVVLGTSEKFHLFSIVNAFTKQEVTQVNVSCIDNDLAFGPAASSDNRTRAFLKVQDGCDYSCSFCTIPMARGKSRSQPLMETVGQAERLAGLGFKEIVLTGVNIGLFGQEYGQTFYDLIRRLEDVEGIERYRISSIEPNLLTEEIIRFISTSAKFQPHVHVPLQSGDNFVLGKMRRRYRRELYAERIETVKSLMPHAGIGVDVIVGFPAEGPDEFEQTRRFIADLPVSYLHVFTYSERPNTISVDRVEDVGAPIPKSERTRRNHILRSLSEKKRLTFYRQHLQTVRTVLWEAAPRDHLMFGYTDNYIRVARPYDAARTGKREPVRLERIGEDGVFYGSDSAFEQLPVFG